jgi:competence protein ComEA
VAARTRLGQLRRPERPTERWTGDVPLGDRGALLDPLGAFLGGAESLDPDMPDPVSFPSSVGDGLDPLASPALDPLGDGSAGGSSRHNVVGDPIGTGGSPHSVPAAGGAISGPAHGRGSSRNPALVGRVLARGSRWVEEFVPASLRRARLDPGWRGVAALAVVALVAAAAAGFGVWRARPRPVEITAPPLVSTARASARASPGRSAGPSVVVAVAGGVRRPGLLTLPSGSRVADAVNAAGGPRPGVDIGLLNLARRLVDGEQVVVGASAAVAAGAPAGPGGGGVAAPGAPLSLNTATVAQLDGLPGVGPVLAARIIAYRDAKGGFRSVDQLREVTGIGEAKYADLRPLVSV